MVCPKCQGTSAVLDTSYDPEANERYRKRKCRECGNVFYTVEYEVETSDQLKKTWNKNYRKHEKKEK